LTVASTLPVVIVTVPTIPVVTLPPVTLPPLPPITLPPAPAPPPAPTPAAAATPLVQVGLNTGVLGLNVGLGPGACTGAQLLTIKLGCTAGPPGLTLGGTLLGGK
jgi:hypothetical protein